MTQKLKADDVLISQTCGKCKCTFVVLRNFGQSCHHGDGCGLLVAPATSKDAIEALAHDLMHTGELSMLYRCEIADALTALQAERDESLNQLDSVKHSVDVLEKRVANLLAERDELLVWKRYWKGEMDVILAGRADESDRADKAEAERDAAVARAEKAEGALVHEVNRSRRHLAQSTLDIVAALSTDTKGE